MKANSRKKTSPDDDWAHREALIGRMDRICAAVAARTNAVLDRLCPSKPGPSRPLEPPARRGPQVSFRGLKVSPLLADPPTDTGTSKEKTLKSLESLFGVLEDHLQLREESHSTSLSVCTSGSFSSVDTQTPRELRAIPLITTPDEVPPPQTAFIPTPPPPPTGPQPRTRKSLIPVMIQRIFKRPEKEAEPQGEPLNKGPKLFRRNSFAPLPRPAAAPKKTHLVPSPKPGPPKTKRSGQRAAVSSSKTSNTKKPAPQIVKPQPKEDLKPLPNPDQSLSLVFQHLGQDDWKKKVEVLELVRALAQHHPDTLMAKLQEVCLAIIDEVKNLRSSVACAAIDTLGSLYIHLQKDMDVEVERSGRALLLRIAQASANVFVQQQINLALEAMVKKCSPGRVLPVLLNTGLSHLSPAVRTSTAQQLHLLADEMGTDAVLTAGPSFTSRFLLALSKMCLDAAAAVRPHGHAVLQQLGLHKDFTKLWEKVVGEKDRLSVQKILQKARRT